MAEKLSDDTLKSIIAKAIANSEHLIDGKLAQERLQVESYYRGEEPKPMHKGDSKYVSRDVFDAVDSMRSTVLEAYTGHNKIVYFSPEKGESVDGAKQATEYTRHVFFKQNNGEDILYDALTDGLQKRMAVAKVCYESIDETEEYDFEGLTMDGLSVELAEFEEYEFTETDISENGLYSGTFTVPAGSSRIKVELVQPEDFAVSSRTCDIADAKYAIHRVAKTKSALLKEGFDKKKVEELNFSSGRDVDFDYEKQSRFEPVDDIISTDDGYQDAVKEIIIHEVYIHLDMEGDGRAKLYKVIYAGDEILDKEPVSRMPFATFVPLPIPHTFYGDNFAAAVIPVQNARTVLIRQIINHSLITNNPRLQVLNGTVQNPNELLDNRVGGLVNVRRMDGIAPINQAPLNPFVFNLIQMIDEDKEEVTGISKLSQGLNKDAISTQNAQGMVEQLISQSQQRQKIIARRFGKFLKDLYFLIYHTAVDYVEEDEYIDVTGSYVPVDPSSWKERTAASVELSLGYGEREMEAQKWAEIDQYLSQDPMLSAGYGYDRRYEVVSRYMDKKGIEDIKRLLTPPEEMKPPEPSPQEQLALAQGQAQVEYLKAQSMAMTAKAESDRLKAQADLIRAQADAGKKQADVVLGEKEFKHEVFMDTEELKAAMALPQGQTKASFNPNE